jgi:hypothetical protein
LPRIVWAWFGVDPDPARDFTGLGARIRFQIGNHFATSGHTRCAFAIAVASTAAVAVATSLSLSAFPGAGFSARTGAQALRARRRLQVAKRPFELRLLLAESGDVFFDQSLALIGWGMWS